MIFGLADYVRRNAWRGRALWQFATRMATAWQGRALCPSAPNVDYFDKCMRLAVRVADNHRSRHCKAVETMRICKILLPEFNTW